MASREILVRLRAEVGNFRSDMRSAGEAVTTAATATRTGGQQMATAMTQAQAAAVTTRQSLFDAGKAAQETAQGFGLSYNAAGRLTDQFGNVVTEAHAAEVGLESASEATQEYAAQTTAAAAEAAAAATAATAASQSGIDALLENAAANEEVWNKVGKGMLAFGAAVTVGVGISIAKFSEFDTAMSSVDAATHETTGNMELLREEAIRVGADTAFSAVEAAQGIEELAKAGVSTKDILSGGLVGSMDLAAAGALDVGEAAEIAATAMTQFKLSGDQIPHVADLLAAGAGKAQGSVQDLGSALKQSGLVASQTGLSIEETTGGLAAFAAAGLVGSDAGTSFKSMLQRLTPQSKEAQKKMDELGISAYDAGGKFVGLEKFAGNLQDSMKGLTDQQRNAAMGVIFGSDAVRAASVIYEKGAEGVGEWIDAVNDSGYAAETAARMQDNLAGDIEKLGGAFDTLMIKSGSGPAEMLRGIVQGAEAAVDALGKMDGGVLSAVTMAGALVGGLALVGGAFITVVPKIAATRASLIAFNAASSGTVTRFQKMGGAAAALSVAFIALSAAKSMIDKSQSGLIATSEKTTQALIGMGNSTKSLDDLFRSFDGKGHFVADGIQGIGDALYRVENLDFNETLNQFTGIGDLLKPAKEQLVQIDESLSDLVTSGNAEAAANAFKQIAAAGAESGVAAEVTAGHFTKYQDALRKQASTLSVALTDEEIYQWALGNTPPLIDAAKASAEGQTAAAEAMAEANEETAQRLAEVGLAADGTVQSLGKLLEAMFATGLAQLSANEASIKWQEALEGLDASIAKYGTSLDITTEAGKANSRALDGVAQAGISNMEAMAANGATQEELQGKLRGTYDSLVESGKRFDMTGEEAEAMARKVLGIPDDANIDTAIQNYAETMARLNGIKNEADALDGKTANVWVTTHQKSIYSEEHQSTGRGGSGGQTAGGWTGGVVGRLAGFDSGGKVPGVAPLNSQGDNILAMVNGKPFGLRSEEWVINEKQSKRNDHWLQAVNAGLNLDDVFGARIPGFADGGTPGHLGESANARANRLYREAQAQVKAAAKAEQKAAKDAAKARTDLEKYWAAADAKAAKAAKKVADAQAKKAKDAADLARNQATYRRDALGDLRLDDNRGQSYKTVTGGISSAYSFSDRLRTAANSGNTPKSKSALLSMANTSDSALRKLYAQSDKLSVSLDKAKDKYTDLLQVRDNVSSSLADEFSLVGAVKKSAFYGVANVKDIQGSASASLAKIRTFGARLNQLQKKGYSGAILQEVAAMGSVDGIQAADVLLAASAAEVKNLNGTYTAIDKASDAAGTYVTNAMYKGGVNAAAGLVKGLESQQAAIEKQMLKIGLGMETALKKALGIKSPSRKAAAIGDNFAGTLVDRLKAGAKPVSSAAAGLGDAMYVAPSKSMAGGYGRSMATAAGGTHSSAGGGTTEVHNHYHIDAKPGLAYDYAKDIANQTVAKSRDLNAAYGINRI